MSTDPVQLEPRQRLTGAALWLAVLVVLLWAVFVAVMIARAGSANEVLWSRYGFLFASVEAVAFAAGGAVWGTTIQRDRAVKAEARADANAKDAASGKALAATIYAEGAPDAPGGPAGVQGFGAGSPDNATARRHAELAKALFPDL